MSKPSPARLCQSVAVSEIGTLHQHHNGGPLISRDPSLFVSRDVLTGGLRCQVSARLGRQGASCSDWKVTLVHNRVTCPLPRSMTRCNVCYVCATFSSCGLRYRGISVPRNQYCCVPPSRDTLVIPHTNLIDRNGKRSSLIPALFHHTSRSTSNSQLCCAGSRASQPIWHQGVSSSRHRRCSDRG